MAKINPFRPNSPVAPGMFVGRVAELERLESHLLQTRAGLPTNFMITGERGIGKSSLLNYLKAVAEGDFETSTDDSRLNFLVVDLDVDQSTTQLGIIRKIEFILRRKLGETERARSILKAAWDFLQRLEAAGVRLDRDEAVLDEVAFEEFAYALSDLAARVCDEEATSLFGSKYDGVLILMDEADNASAKLDLGTFLKLLSERLERHGCSKILFGLAGLPELRNRLADSHPSSVRLFDEIKLARLSAGEIGRIIDRCLEVGEQSTGHRVVTTNEGKTLLVDFSEGFPHFIQQFGYSAFNADEDDVIDAEDVAKGAFGRSGAVESIGDRYYRDSFYKKIQEENYRQVLRIMADHSDGWVTKSHIRSQFKGTNSSLDNAIKALRERKIILSKEGEKGVYRLQQRGFALWIKLYTQAPPRAETIDS